jgi:hypothetical protein
MALLIPSRNSEHQKQSTRKFADSFVIELISFLNREFLSREDPPFSEVSRFSICDTRPFEKLSILRPCPLAVSCSLHF